MILKLTDTAEGRFDRLRRATPTTLAALIGQPVYDEIEAEIVKQQLATSSFVSEPHRRSPGRSTASSSRTITSASTIRASYTAYELDEDGSASVVAVFDTEEILPPTNCSPSRCNKNGGLYALYAAQFACVFDMHFADVYCRDGDRPATTNLETNELGISSPEHVNDARDAQERTSKRAPTASIYTFAEYIYLAYGAKSEADMINKYYIKSTLQPYRRSTTASSPNDWDAAPDVLLYDLVQEYYDNYFSLDVQTLQIYVDRDENGNRRRLREVRRRTRPTSAAYDLMLDDFEAAIRAYFDEDDVTGPSPT
ncbi:MAG: hypothetical protein MZU97_24480 [Bacillus subtilis]|nr:hypothetical protein [Bacillus subtilis]